MGFQMVLMTTVTIFAQLEDYLVKPCSSRTGYDFLPRKQQQIDLGKASQKLREKGYVIDFETPIFFSAKVIGKSVSMFKSGKISVKDEKNKEEARQAVMKILHEIKA